MRGRIKQKKVRLSQSEAAGFFYYDNMTYYRNVNGLGAKVILMYPDIAGKKEGRVNG